MESCPSCVGVGFGPEFASGVVKSCGVMSIMCSYRVWSRVRIRGSHVESCPSCVAVGFGPEFASGVVIGLGQACVIRLIPRIWLDSPGGLTMCLLRCGVVPEMTIA